MLDKVCLDDDYDDLPMNIKKKYEEVSDSEELNPKALSLFKLDLYSKHKNGTIDKP